MKKLGKFAMFVVMSVLSVIYPANLFAECKINNPDDALEYFKSQGIKPEREDSSNRIPQIIGAETVAVFTLDGKDVDIYYTSDQAYLDKIEQEGFIYLNFKFKVIRKCNLFIPYNQEFPQHERIKQIFLNMP